MSSHLVFWLVQDKALRACWDQYYGFLTVWNLYFKKKQDRFNNLFLEFVNLIIVLMIR